MDKIKSPDKLKPNQTEWFGYYSKNGITTQLKAKSFENVNSEDISLIYASLFYILGNCGRGDILNLNKNIKLIEGKIDHTKTAASSNILEFYLYFILMSLYKKIIEHDYFFYIKKKENTKRVRGRIDFSKNILRNFGLKHLHVCDSKKLLLDHPLLSLTKHLYSFFSLGLKKKNIPLEMIDEIDVYCSFVNSIFSESSELKNYHKECVNLLNGVYDNKSNTLFFLPELKSLANIYLSSSIFIQEQKTKEKIIDGIVLNLNRPFEIILRKSCEAYWKDARFLHSTIDKFTKIKFKHGGDSQMKPDCWFLINDTEVILDAKHKIYSLVQKGENGLSPSFYNIDQKDIYQILSYANFRPHSDKIKNGAYALVALNKEESLHSDQYISLKKNTFTPEKSKIDINLITMNLGKFLKDLGESILGFPKTKLASYPEHNIKYEYDGIFTKLGEEINQILEITPSKDLIDLIEKFHENLRLYNDLYRMHHDSFGDRKAFNSLVLFYLKLLKKRHICDLSEVNIPNNSREEFVKSFTLELPNILYEEDITNFNTFKIIKRSSRLRA